ncbi:MAG: ParA family protein [Butyricicoccus sp.]
MKTISIVNLKGGVGKTVTAVNLAGILAADYGKRVLLVDSDPQGDASQYIGVVPDACSTADLFDGGSAYYEDVIQHTIYRDLDIIPADMQLASVDLDADIDRKQAVRVYADLRDALVEDDAYDVMIFDCPPSFSLPCISAIAASDAVFVPIKPGAFEMSGMRLLADQIASVRVRSRRCVVGLLIWPMDATRQSEDWLREHSPIPLFQQKIRRTDKVTESTYAAQPVTRWSPTSAAARDYRAWVEELMEVQ